MSKEINFEALNIPRIQADKLKNQFITAGAYVFEKDPGIDASMDWLKSGLYQYLSPNEVALLYQIALNNQPDNTVQYLEQGYDSCQSHRKVSKVVAEAILLGGLTHEYKMLGIQTDVAQIKKLINSKLLLDSEAESALPVIADIYGANQDFLFPGVTPTDADTPSLGQMAFDTLNGQPSVSVRNLSGVGGLRYDKDWNYVSDFATFIKLKIEEDKRYYPGIGLYHALLTYDPSEIPLLASLKKTNPASFEEFLHFSDELKEIKPEMYQGVSVLCSNYLPSWGEMKKYQGFAGNIDLNFSESFHSPAYDFSQLKGIFDSKKGVVLDKTEHKQLKLLRERFSTLWSFNSTIHLPWTSEIAGLSNDLMGGITNHSGDYAIRYGIGHNGASLEVREYNFGAERNFPGGISGKKSYALSLYPESEIFKGKKETKVLDPGTETWINFQKNGFMRSAIEYLKQDL